MGINRIENCTTDRYLKIRRFRRAFVIGGLVAVKVFYFAIVFPLFFGSVLAQPINLTRLTVDLLSTSFVAGDEIIAIIKVFDETGLIPGTYCTRAAYQDTVGTGLWQSKPIVTHGFIAVEMNVRPDTTSKLDQCFTNGIDTVKLLMWNASSTSHTIWARIGNIEGMSTSFQLKPGGPEVLRIKNSLTNTDTNALTMFYPNGNVQFTSEWYDGWHNLIGEVQCAWKQTGSLHPISFPIGSKIYYSTASVSQEESGFIIATTNTNPVLNDTIQVAIKKQMTGVFSLSRSMQKSKIVKAQTLTDIMGRTFNNHVSHRHPAGLYICKVQGITNIVNVLGDLKGISR